MSKAPDPGRLTNNIPLSRQCLKLALEQLEYSRHCPAAERDTHTAHVLERLAELDRLLSAAQVGVRTPPPA